MVPSRRAAAAPTWGARKRADPTRVAPTSVAPKRAELTPVGRRGQEEADPAAAQAEALVVAPNRRAAAAEVLADTREVPAADREAVPSHRAAAAVLAGTREGPVADREAVPNRRAAAAPTWVARKREAPTWADPKRAETATSSSTTRNAAKRRGPDPDRWAWSWHPDATVRESADRGRNRRRAPAASRPVEGREERRTEDSGAYLVSRGPHRPRNCCYPLARLPAVFN